MFFFSLCIYKAFRDSAFLIPSPITDEHGLGATDFACGAPFELPRWLLRLLRGLTRLTFFDTRHRYPVNVNI